VSGFPDLGDTTKPIFNPAEPTFASAATALSPLLRLIEDRGHDAADWLA